MTLTFPLTLGAEIYLNGAWVDITDYVYQRDALRLTRGRSGEFSSAASSGSCSITLDNRDYRFSTRLATGPYYGYLVKNTPLRVFVVSDYSRLHFPRTSNISVSTPDSAGISVTGDIDVRVDVDLPSWRWYHNLAGKWTTTGNQRSWMLNIHATGIFQFAWSNTGSDQIDAYSTVPIPLPISGRKAVRATLDVNNGSGGYTVTFYTSDTIDGSWTQLGDPVITTSGTTSIYDSTASLEIGDFGVDSYDSEHDVYEMKVLSGIGGTEVANPDFTIQSHGAASFVDTAGNTWTISSPLEIVKRDYRFSGEISDWAPMSDQSGTDLYVQVTASGPFRRLNQGTPPALSAYHRTYSRAGSGASGVVGYWPCEEEVGSETIASPLSDGSDGAVIGSVVFEADSTSFVCSSALPTMGTGAFVLKPSYYGSTGGNTVRCLVSVPSAGATNGAIILRAWGTGDVRRVDVIYGTGGTLAAAIYDEDGASLGTIAAAAYGINGVPGRLGLHITTGGVTTDVRITWLAVGQYSGYTTTVTGVSGGMGKISEIDVAPARNLAGVTCGHVSLQDVDDSAYSLYGSISAWSGPGSNWESAQIRFRRLCDEEGISHITIGEEDDRTSSRGGGPAMGPQLPGTMPTLINECENAGMGIVCDARAFPGLMYVTRGSMLDRSPDMTLSYTGGDILRINMVDDDQALYNRVKVTRPGGTSKTSERLSGNLTPAVAGLYETSVTVNVALDTVLGDIANWRVVRGTADQYRYPIVGVELAREAFTSDDALTLAARKADIGSVVSITDWPEHLPPDDVSLLITGVSETLTPFSWAIEWQCVPYSPYEVGTIAGSKKMSSSGSTLSADVTSTGTSLSVSTPLGPLWGHDDGDYDVVVGGEVMTVTAVTGSTSPQTLTVTRSVNTVVKAHSSGSSVALKSPLRMVV